MNHETAKPADAVTPLPRRLRLFYGIGEFGQQFSVMSLSMFLLFFFGFLAPYTLIAGFILVIAAVACFIGADFGITEGLIEDLNI